MTDIEKAKECLKAEGATCAICKGETAYVSNKSGIAPMLDFLADGTDLRGFSAADKIVGKAAAMLFICAGVHDVYGEIMSKPALSVLEKNGIGASCEILIDAIMNRSGDGLCPMEMAVANIDNPLDAKVALQEKLTTLLKGKLS